MRASTLFAIIVALLLGLGAVAVARFFHLFERQPLAPPTVTPPAPVAEVRKVLVAKGNLVADYALMLNDVMVRPMTPDEVSDYQREPSKYLPATPNAVSLRILAKNVDADMPILREYLKPLVLPKSVTELCDPGMLPVELALPKERASGGLLRVGEYVDVFLTTRIGSDNESVPLVTRTALIARKLKVIIRRGTPWNILAPLPEGQPLLYTLEANPYRAALLEFAKNKGHLILLATQPPPEGQRPEDVRPGDVPNFNGPGPEFENENKRVEAVLMGHRSVGEADLERIFGLRPMVERTPYRVERIGGTTVKGVTEFLGPPTIVPGSGNPDQPEFGYRFQPPPEPVVASAEGTRVGVSGMAAKGPKKN